MKSYYFKGKIINNYLKKLWYEGGPDLLDPPLVCASGNKFFTVFLTFSGLLQDSGPGNFPQCPPPLFSLDNTINHVLVHLNNGNFRLLKTS